MTHILEQGSARINHFYSCSDDYNHNFWPATNFWNKYLKSKSESRKYHKDRIFFACIFAYLIQLLHFFCQGSANDHLPGDASHTIKATDIECSRSKGNELINSSLNGTPWF